MLREYPGLGEGKHDSLGRPVRRKARFGGLDIPGERPGSEDYIFPESGPVRRIRYSRREARFGGLDIPGEARFGGLDIPAERPGSEG